MKKLAWITDIHLNFLERSQRQQFYNNIVNTNVDAVMLTGDISESSSVCDILKEMQLAIGCCIYFVLGNHDYYLSSVKVLRAQIIELTKEFDQLTWLGNIEFIKLSSDTVLVGQDGWADGRIGDFCNSNVRLNDERCIGDLFEQKCISRECLLAKMQELADSDALKLSVSLESAKKLSVSNIIVMTHVPPFKENCLYGGNISDDSFLPYFSSKILRMLLRRLISSTNSFEV